MYAVLHEGITRKISSCDRLHSTEGIMVFPDEPADHRLQEKVFLVLDNLRVHHANKDTEWLEEHRNRIELFYLPPYSREYNLDE